MPYVARKAAKSSAEQNSMINDDYFSPSTPYPVGSLPPLLRDFTERVSQHTQVSPALAAPVVISAAAAAVQGLIDVETPYGAAVPASLFFLVSPRTGDRMSAVTRSVRPAFTDFEMGSLAAALTNSGIAAEPPLPFHQFFTDVATYQGIVDLQLANANSLFAASDEGSRNFKTFSSADWCKNWDADPIRINTRKTGAIVLRDKRISLCLSVQAPILKGILQRKGEELLGSGFLPRTLFSMPPSLQGSRDSFIGNGLERFSTAGHALHHRLRDLMIEYSIALGQGATFKRKIVRLAPEAMNCWRDFDRDIEARLAPGGEFHDIAGFAAKAVENLLRMAGVFEYVQTGQLVISGWTMYQAATVVWWYLHETKRTLGRAPPEVLLAHHAAILMQWLHSQPNGNVTQGMVERLGPAPVRKKEYLEATLYYMEQRSWISSEYTGKTRKIHLTPPRWAY